MCSPYFPAVDNESWQAIIADDYKLYKAEIKRAFAKDNRGANEMVALCNEQRRKVTNGKDGLNIKSKDIIRKYFYEEEDDQEVVSPTCPPPSLPLCSSQKLAHPLRRLIDSDCGQNSRREDYLRVLHIPDGDASPDVPICEAFFEITHNATTQLQEYDFPSQKLMDAAQAMTLLESGDAGPPTGDEEPTLDLVSYVMVQFMSYKYSPQGRIGNAALDVPAITTVDFPVAQAEVQSVMNWMANPAFCPSR